MSRALSTLSTRHRFVRNHLRVDRSFVNIPIAIPDEAVDLGHVPISKRDQVVGTARPDNPVSNFYTHSLVGAGRNADRFPSNRFAPNLFSTLHVEVRSLPMGDLRPDLTREERELE